MNRVQESHTLAFYLLSECDTRSSSSSHIANKPPHSHSHSHSRSFSSENQQQVNVSILYYYYYSTVNAPKVFSLLAKAEVY